MLENLFANFDFHPEMFIHNLKYMGLGMLCILIVMMVIILITMLLNKATAAIAAKKAEKDAENE
ncbi:MAG: hypothetical protein E7672_05300 [Ruminococcaceae bacterium]|nr:hypothetical protein [Oscillospiraceae bacterium]